MNIRGIYKTSLINFPGRICTILFTGGCNLRCRYCHNPELVLGSHELERYSTEYILSFMKKRKRLVNAVTLSGGEPTLDPDIEPFLKELKAAGLDVKLDTNGLNPSVTKILAVEKLIDYAAVDVKTSPEKYNALTGRPVDFGTIKETIALLADFHVPMEIRTTCVPGFAEIDDFEKIHQSLGRVNRYYIQQFVPSDNLLDKEMSALKPYSSPELHERRAYIKSFADICEIRGE
ncbi:MAG: anaerobic ribonucleoside-triphosphate reductase activating protein [Spirochaetia bacterium]|jgi:pyruvate formate lyase activating enzyme|nr:anaerobic ribonucleoside-triphosphate reductase activating protein [Spirochaetia bacterium]